MEDAFTLLNKLLTRPNDEIDIAILILMIKGKLNSHKVFDLYMKAIEHDKNDLKDRLIESNTNILDLILNLKKPSSKQKDVISLADKAIHRGLYNLNTSRQFNMKSLNEKYGYNEDEDKKLSWYWRTNEEK